MSRSTLVFFSALLLLLGEAPASAAKIRVWILYGVGGQSTSSGMDTLAYRLRNLGSQIEVRGPYQFDQWQQVASEMKSTPPEILVAVAGYSCGANNAPMAAASVASRTVALVAGIQASTWLSIWCRSPILSRNVVAAREIYNPNCFQTGGLGCQLYQPGPGFAGGRLTIIKRYDMHPYADLDPDAQNDVIEAIKMALASSNSRAFKIYSRVPHVVVRHSTQR